MAQTRVTLAVLLNRYALGDNAEALHDGFPTVPLSEIHAVICYYLRNRGPVDAWLAERAAREDRVLTDLGKRFHQPSREAMEARLAERSASPR